MRRVAPYLLFGAVTLAVFWRFLLFGDTLYGVAILEKHLGLPYETYQEPFAANPSHGRMADDILLLPSHHRLYNEGLKEGELRLWNHKAFCGYPLYTNGMVHFLYPPHLLLHAALPPLVARETSLMLHFFFSGVAMFWALRIFRQGRAGATVGGLVWMLIGYNAAWFFMATLPGASVFAPLALAWLVQGLERRDLRRAALAGAAMGMVLLASHAQHALHLFLFFMVWLAVAFVRARDARRFTATFAAVFASLTIGTGLAVSLPLLEVISQGTRFSGGDIDTFYAEPVRVFGQLLGLVLSKAWFLKGDLEPEFCCYIGAAALTLALAGAVRGFREPLIRFITLFGAAALLVSFTRPLAAILHLVPFLNLSPPQRWIMVAGFCLAVLSGRGVDALAVRLGRVPHALAAATLALFMICLFGAGPLRFSNGAAVATLIGFALAAAAAFTAMRHRPTGLTLAVIAILFDLFLYFGTFNKHTDPAVLDEPPQAVLEVRKREPGRSMGGLWQNFDARNPVRELHHGNCFLALYGMENVAGFEAVIPSRYLEFCTASGGRMLSGGRVILFTSLDSPLLDAVNLRYLSLPPQAPPPERFRKIGHFGTLIVYENDAALPRAWIAGSALAAGSKDEAVRLLHDPSFDPHKQVILETGSLPPMKADPKRSRVRWERPSSDTLRLNVRCTGGDGLLVISETHHPDWEALVDGSPTPVYRANVAFRAVRVAEGEHTVEFNFRPTWVRRGTVASLLFLLLAIGYGTLRRRHAKV